MTAKPLLELRDVWLGYAAASSRTGTDGFIVRGADLTLAPGEFLLVHGENGSGKTTLLRGMLGLLPLVRGLLRWGIAPAEIGYAPQDAAIEADTPATALDVVRAADPGHWNRNRDAGLAALERTGMGDSAGMRFSDLSGGQRRRVLLARAMLGAPKVLLLDEPTANVDEATRREMEIWVNGMRERHGTAVIAISHEMDWAPSARKLRLGNGKLLPDGTESNPA